jgi:thiamine monophosphate synthase
MPVSKLIDKLKQVFQPAPPVMGFRQNDKETTRPKIQLIALLSRSQEALANKISTADAIIKTDIKNLPIDVIWGLVPDKISIEEVNKAAEVGADFIVFPADGEVLPADKKMGKVLQIDTLINDLLLRTVNELPVGAVMVTDNESGYAITWRKLMQCRRFASIVSKPVLVIVPPDVSASEIQLIWDTGISGIVVEIKSASDASAIAKIRELINGLRYPSQKKRERVTPFIPQGSVAVLQPEEPEEPDEDD